MSQSFGARILDKIFKNAMKIKEVPYNMIQII